MNPTGVSKIVARTRTKRHRHNLLRRMAFDMRTRRFGRAGTVPLFFLGYFNSNMDAWDPTVTNGLAADHEIILFDNAGVGRSGGETPSTVAEMTQCCAAFCRALGLKAIHVVGVSLGGMIAQQLALDHPELVQRLILLGRPRVAVKD